jgi:hypothetical protein
MIPWRYALPFTLAATFDEHQSCARITYHVHVVIAALGLFVPQTHYHFSRQAQFPCHNLLIRFFIDCMSVLYESRDMTSLYLMSYYRYLHD